MPYNNILYKKYKIALPVWTVILPLSAVAILILSGLFASSGLFSIVLGAFLIGVVLAAVHHAEVVAHKVGEPYGTLILALAITIIEVSLIVSIMLSDRSGGSGTLARDTVFAAIMIILTGIIGLCLLVGGYRFKEQLFMKHLRPGDIFTH
ncbi:MAG: ionic transporter y4hA, partial [Chitinophagaceae bacterium]